MQNILVMWRKCLVYGSTANEITIVKTSLEQYKRELENWVKSMQTFNHPYLLQGCRWVHFCWDKHIRARVLSQTNWRVLPFSITQIFSLSMEKISLYVSVDRISLFIHWRKRRKDNVSFKWGQVSIDQTNRSEECFILLCSVASKDWILCFCTERMKGSPKI